MAKLKPFKAIRPVRDKVHLVATRPYYSYKKNVLKAKLEDNPFTFLHIINPEFGSKKRTRPNSKARFRLVRQKYEEFLAEGILKEDPEETLYIYRQHKNGRVYTGIIAGASVAEYESGKIKKHEATLTSRESTFTQYLDVVGFNAEPVLLSYPDNDQLHGIVDKCMTERPEYEFTTTDGVKHELWVLTRSQTQVILQEFEKIDSLYIADGHHRSASSVAFSKQKRDRDPESNVNYFLSFLIAESSLDILEFNRLIGTLNGYSAKAFLSKLADSFTITSLKSARKPEKEHEYTLCLEGRWYSVACKEEILNDSDPVRSLDSDILTRYVLAPILDIHDLKTDSRIEFISGAEPLEKMEELVRSKKFDMLFVLYPATMEQVRRVADHELIMPPKSTWVEPKLRSGLTIFNLNQ